ncbi:MAG: hypothetical protein IJ737_08070 [Ruminococcus sp.]|nr:hypothetical protein [Ruminococcus sp.]
MNEDLKTVEIDVEKGVIKVNGNNLPDVDFFELRFEGSWHLSVRANYRVHGMKKAPEYAGAKTTE